MSIIFGNSVKLECFLDRGEAMAATGGNNILFIQNMKLFINNYSLLILIRLAIVKIPPKSNLFRVTALCPGVEDFEGDRK